MNYVDLPFLYNSGDLQGSPNVECDILQCQHFYRFCNNKWHNSNLNTGFFNLFRKRSLSVNDKNRTKSLLIHRFHEIVHRILAAAKPREETEATDCHPTSSIRLLSHCMISKNIRQNEWVHDVCRTDTIKKIYVR